MPYYFEYSRLPRLLSKIAPITINAITLGPFIFSRGKMSQNTKQHEAIHWEQQKELLIIGFLLVYLYDYLHNRFVIGMEGRKAYRYSRAEIEAYNNEYLQDYLETRKRYAWLKTTRETF